MSRPDPVQTVLKLAVAVFVSSVLVAAVLLPVVGGAAVVARQQADKFLDQPCTLKETLPAQKTTLLARDGKTVIAYLFTQDREAVPLKKVAKIVLDALIATEDRRFYSHHGVDLRGLARGAFSTTSGDTQGGSTLTMQYVKQERFYQATTDEEREAAIAQNINRKIEDAKCAMELEETHSKNQILEKYLNIAFFGENSYGIATAARNYFGKTVDKLSLPEAALLVGVVKAPTDYNPFVNPRAARDRRNKVIQNLADTGGITQAQADQAKAAPLGLASDTPPPVQQGCANAPQAAVKNPGFFCEYAKEWLRTVGGLAENVLTTGGFRIVTTLDPATQNSIQATLPARIPPKGRMTAIMPAINPRNGEVLAMGSSKQFGTKPGGAHTETPIFTVQASGPGSTMKYFALIAALKAGARPDLSLQSGLKYTVKNCGSGGPEGPYTIEDASGSFSNETLRSATVKSSNTYFVSLVDQLFECNLKPVVDQAVLLGLRGFDPKPIVNESRTTFTLGQDNVSPLELASAYGAAANDGKWCPPMPIVKVLGPDGKERPLKKPACVQAMTPQVARTAIDILVGDTTQGGGTAEPQFNGWYGNGGGEVAAKTGTNNTSEKYFNAKGNSSLWFVGVTPELVSTTALINIKEPGAPAADLPGTWQPEFNAFGAYAATLWVDALSPVLLNKEWDWPDPFAIDGGIDVPNVLGNSLEEAKSRLESAGFKVEEFAADNSPACGSSYSYNTVGYYGPTFAAPGTTITLCLSNGKPLEKAYIAPPRTFTPRPGPPPATSRPPASTPRPPASTRPRR